jgi:hypothetical protein
VQEAGDEPGDEPRRARLAGGRRCGLLVIEAGRWDEEDSLAFKVLRDAACRWCWWSTRSIA